MKRTSSIWSASRLTLALAASWLPLSGQWVKYPTAGVPRLADGKPNLSAPAPRMPDGKVDFSGFWYNVRNRPCPPDGCFDLQVSQEFVNLGWSLPGGLPYQPWARELVKERMAQNGKDDPGTYCLPIGFLRMHTDGAARKIVQVHDMLVILNERNTSYRQIFLDGRPLPVDPNPSFNGYSTGRWEGDTLVIETNGFRDGLWLDRNGSPLSESAKVTERWRRPDFGHMQVELQVDDPKAYTRPWTVMLNMEIVLDSDLLEFTCLENENSIPHLVGK